MKTYTITFISDAERDEAARVLYDVARSYQRAAHKAKANKRLRASERVMTLAACARVETIMNRLGNAIGGEHDRRVLFGERREHPNSNRGYPSERRSFHDRRGS